MHSVNGCTGTSAVKTDFVKFFFFLYPSLVILPSGCIDFDAGQIATLQFKHLMMNFVLIEKHNNLVL